MIVSIDLTAVISYTTHMETKSTGEQLIDQLEAIRLHLNSLRERLESSGVERTYGLKEAMGNDCRFYKRSVDKFLTEDYLDIRSLVKEAERLFKEVENE